MGSRSNTIAFAKAMPFFFFFALHLINSVIELGGLSILKHPRLPSLIQDELFCNLMQV